jgi:hypothetical protein
MNVWPAFNSAAKLPLGCDDISIIPRLVAGGLPALLRDEGRRVAEVRRRRIHQKRNFPLSGALRVSKADISSASGEATGTQTEEAVDQVHSLPSGS